MNKFNGSFILAGFLASTLIAAGAFSGTVLDRMAALAHEADREGRAVVEGKSGWLYLVSELRHLAAGRFWGEASATVGRAARPDARDPLPAILDFNRALQEKGVKLILVPVPAKAVIYPEFLPGPSAPAGGERPDRQHREFYSLLRTKGVEVLDLTDQFRSGPEPERGPLYCRRDSHWSGTGCVRAAEILAGAVRPLLSGSGGRTYPVAWKEIEIEGDLGRMLAGAGGPRETIAVRQVEGETIDPSSPVLVLGDSHALVFHAGGDMHARGAGLADQLARELGRPVELIGVRGSGATPARINLFRRAQADPGYWSSRRAVVWVFSAREFTESDGWRLVPIAR